MSEPEPRCAVCGNFQRFCACAALARFAERQAEEAAAIALKSDERKSCDNCAHAAAVDYGYSNYTVEGADFHCTLGLHPDAPFDRFYGDDVRLRFADTCLGFAAGEGVSIDVEREDLDDLTPPQRVWWERIDGEVITEAKP